MASFTIIGSSTTAQTLTSSENGVIGLDGFLSVTSAIAISLSGSGSDLTILGAVVASDADAVFGNTSSFDILIGSGGQVISSASDAIDIRASAISNIVNGGTVIGMSQGMVLGTVAGTATFQVSNTGTISARQGAILAEAGTGTFRLDNGGTIETTSSSTAVNLTAANLVLRNSGNIHGSVIAESTNSVSILNAGTIIGDVDVAGTQSFATVRNTGTIMGGISLDGAGVIDITDGLITGSLSGGEGNNTFIIDRDDIGISDSGVAGIDTVITSATFAISVGIERLILVGGRDIRAFGNSTNDNLDGNRGDNRISGLSGADTLFGGDGDDTLRGGDGNDLLQLDSGSDTLIGGDGIDTVASANPSVAISVNLATGVVTSSVNDQDSLSGIENATGGNGADTLTGSAEANVLNGGAGNDSLTGGGGEDRLLGGIGADTLRGGGGADAFVYQALTESGTLAPDLIADFSTAQGDKIDLSFIDPDPGVNAQFVFNGADFLPEGLPSVRVFQDNVNNVTIVEARDTAGASADLRIVLTGLLTLTGADFLL